MKKGVVQEKDESRLWETIQTITKKASENLYLLLVSYKEMWKKLWRNTFCVFIKLPEEINPWWNS